MKARAVRFHKTGGPEVLQLETVEIGEPRAGEVLVRHTAIGLNYQDIYQRSGFYPMPLPSGVGPRRRAWCSRLDPRSRK